MTLHERQSTFALNVSRLIKYIYDNGYTCSLGEAFRTAEQAEIYAKEGKGIKDSLHCQRLAIDINIFSPSGEYLSQTCDYKLFGTFWETLNPLNKWGGSFSRADGNHFEMHL